MVAEPPPALARLHFLVANTHTTTTSNITPNTNECVAVLTNRMAARNAKPPKSKARTATAASLATVAGFNRPRG